MLRIRIPQTELWDEVHEEFLYVKEQTLTLEHSLVSISKWEAKWRKPFISSEKKTMEETLDYARCMTLTQNVDPLVYRCLSSVQLATIDAYIEAPMTATWFSDKKDGPKSRSSQQVTSELIYYWMVSYQIPFECQKWHLNRLLTLIRVCNEENKPKKKKSQREIMKSNAELNAARRKKYHSHG